MALIYGAWMMWVVQLRDIESSWCAPAGCWDCWGGFCSWEGLGRLTGASGRSHPAAAGPTPPGLAACALPPAVDSPALVPPLDTLRALGAAPTRRAVALTCRSLAL